VKNLDGATEIKTVAGDEKKQQDSNGAMVLFEVKRHTRGISDETINTHRSLLHRLERLGADLFNPTKVWHAIDNATKPSGEPWSSGSKKIAAQAYMQFCKASNIAIPEDLNFHKWHQTFAKLPFIPTREELANLIGAFRTRTAAFLTMLMETGFRSGEAWGLRWTDLDLERGIVTLNDPEKGSLPRQQKISGKLVAMLNLLPKNTEKIWGDKNRAVEHKKLYFFRIRYCAKRNRIAFNLQNPRIKQIRLHTMRHYYATMEYHKTKCLVHVQEKLGHKSILNTVVYTHLVDFNDDEYNSTVAKTQTEKLELLSKGWEFICQDREDGLMYFRKRK
jgi:site-specific recombinase XerD